jgi:PGF-CTERM protein
VTVTGGSETAGDSWNGLLVNYSETGTDVSNVGQNDVERMGIDRGDDSPGATVDVNVSDDLSSVSGSENGTVLTVGLGGNYDLQEGDEVVVVYGDAQNPPEAVYDVPVDVNPQSTGGTAVAEMPVLGSIDFTTTETTPNTDTTSETTAGGTTPTDTATPTTESAQTAESPGFGTAMALLALVGAAALLARR